jgi:DNA-binding MarR family transcriptional regulator
MTPRGGARRPANADLAEQLLEVVPQTTRRIRREMRRQGIPGLTVAQLRALLFVRRHPGCGLSALADHLGMSLPASSALVQRLVTAGFADRTDHPIERRRVQLNLTALGSEHVARTQAAVRAWLADELAVFTLDEQRLLSRALDLLDRVGRAGDPEPRGRSG